MIHIGLEESEAVDLVRVFAGRLTDALVLEPPDLEAALHHMGRLEGALYQLRKAQEVTE